MPGIIVSTTTRIGPSGAGEVEAAQFFVVGTAERGATDEPVLIRGMSEYDTYFGTYSSGNLFSYAKTYFEEGGERLWIYRVVGAGASAGQLILQDRNATPANTLQIDATNVGSWSDNVDIEVLDGDSANTFKIKVYLNDVLQYTTRDLTSPSDAVSVLNTSSVNHLITVTDMSSATTAPDNNPAVQAATPLTGGADGSAPVEADYTTGLDAFTYDLGVGAVAIPGQSSTGIWSALLSHAADNNRIALCAFSETDTIATAKTAVASYYSNAAAEYAAFYYPWIKIPDPATSGLTINVSPEAFAAAARAKAIKDTGPWRAGAGLISHASYVSGVVTNLSLSDANGLDEKRINAIRKIAGGIRVYGARSVDSDEDNWRYITMRDTVNTIVADAEERLEDYIFQTIDSRGALFARIEAALIGMLDPIRVSGGLYEAYDSDGNLIDPGYSVEVSDAINPVAQLANGQVNAKIGVRVSSVGDQIEVTITKSNLTASVV